MAFFDFLFGNSIQKHARRIANRDAQAEDREASAAWLAKEGSDEALIALCARFGLQLEHQLKDKKEKEAVIEYLVEAGARGAAAARAYAKSSPAFAWPIRVVEQVDGATAGTDVLLELLSHERVEEEFHTEKKQHLLIMLAERRDPRILGAAAPYLRDFAEGVRNAAVEAVASQQSDDARIPLLAALTNQKEESTRIRGRVAELFAERGWAIDGDAWLIANIPVGFRTDGERLYSAR